MTRHPDGLAVRLSDKDAPNGDGHFGGYTGLLIASVIAILSGILVFVESPLAFLAAMTDGMVALGIVAAASLAGLWLVWASGNGDLPVRWQIGLGGGFGLGVLSLGTLWAGLRGYMGQQLWIGILVVLAVAGLAALYRLMRQAGRPSRIAPGVEEASIPPSARGARGQGRWVWLWLLLVLPIVLGILVATVPPGWLWAEEGNGYDVLEYHLGVPKEYFFLGRIEYLDHNVYSNFPMNAEMLYLVPMLLYASPFKAALAAKMINLLLGALTAYTAWLIGRDYSPKAGILTGLAGACLPWTLYLSGMAYVENGMLLYGLLAAGLVNRTVRDAGEQHWSRALAIGAMAGLACGYKYTAVPMVAVPVLGLWVVLSLARQPLRISNALIPFVIAAVFFGPWAIKNRQMTGNPVFPLGHGVFGSTVWTAEEHARFARDHAPLPNEQPVAARLGLLFDRVLAEPHFGHVPWILAGLAGGVAITRRVAHRREVLAWLAVLALQVAVWLFATHLFARFASIVWIPLVFLIAAVSDWATRGRIAGEDRSAQRGSTPSATRALRPDGGLLLPGLAVAGLVVFLGISMGVVGRDYWRHLHPNGQYVPLHGNTEAFFYGNVPGYDHLALINGDGQKPGLPMNARLLMVADARIFYIGRPADYTVVFSRSRFARAVAEASDAGEILAWMQRQGYSHVWVDFAEMARLGKTYGLPPQFDPQLFARLETAGLKRLDEVDFHHDGRPDGILYEVPKP